MATSTLAKYGLGGDQNAQDARLENLLKEAKRRNKSPEQLCPIVQSFNHMIESDAIIYMGFNQMFDQIPHKLPFNVGSAKKPQIGDYKTMLQVLDVAITQAPSYEQNVTVDFPINAIFSAVMETQAGLATLLNPMVNQQFKAMFNAWAQFLASSESCSVLTDAPGGWFSPQAINNMPDFVETYVCDPSAPHYGFQSWDDFFTRKLLPGVRPFQFPDNPLVINSACESTVYNIAHNIQASDKFWLKGRQYSLTQMLNDDPLASQFVGGTVYQTFLGATSYHRWHSPIDGTVSRTVEIPGGYFSSAPDLPGSIVPSAQTYMASTPARQLMFIKSDNPAIGLMCFIAVGMTELSSCEVNVRDGQKINKGDELGMFHFGGSTHCLIFRPDTKISFDPTYSVGTIAPVGSAIATVAS